MPEVLLVSSTNSENPAERVRAHTEAIIQGGTLSALRKKKGWSRERLADKTNCSVPAIAKYERERCTLSFERFSTMLTLLVSDKDAQEIEYIFMSLNKVLARNII